MTERAEGGRGASLQPETEPRRLVLALASATFVLLWSSGFVAAKLAVPFAEPCTFLALRFAIVLAVAAPLGLLSARARQAPRRALAHAVVAGALMQGLYLSCVVWSVYLGMPAGVVALTVSLHPITTAVLARLVLGERISWLGWLGFVLGVAGAAAVLWPKLDLGSSGITPATIALCLLALPAMSAGTIYQKRNVAGMGAIASLAAQHAGGLAVVAAGACLLETRHVDWTPVMIGALLWQAIAVSFGAVGLLLLMLRVQAASRATSVFYLIPAGSAALTYLTVGESLVPVQIAGVATVTMAVFLIGYRPARLRAPSGAMRGDDAAASKLSTP